MSRILVVDDNEDAREITCAFLMASGYDDLLEAESGQAALDLLAGSAEPAMPDAVLLDVMMAGIDGIETCARIRSDPRLGDLPVLMVTTLNDMEALAQAFVAGATDFITKPLRRIELSARLRSALRLKAEFELRQAREAALRAALRENAPEAIGADPASGLPDRATFDALLPTTPENAAIIAALIDRIDAMTEAEALSARHEVAGILATVPAPLGAVLADLGQGLFGVLAPPGSAAAPTAAALREAIGAAALPAATGGLSGTLSLSVGYDRVGSDARYALARAIRAAERASALGGDRVLPA